MPENEETTGAEEQRKPRMTRSQREVAVDYDLPEHQQVHLHASVDYTVVHLYGVMYQKCGGGRRIIRKTRGAS